VSKLSADGSALLWSTLLPSPGLTGVAIDGSGNVLAVCTPLDTGILTTPNAIVSGDRYRWLGELDSSGARLVYATYVPGLQSTSVTGGMAIGQDGTAWIGGTAPGFSILANGGCTSLPYPPTPAAVIGVDPNISRVVANVTIGGSGQNYGTSVGLDADGNIYLAGMTCSPDFPGINNSIGTGAPGFIVKLSPGAQARLWTATTPGWPMQLAADPSGNTTVLLALYPADALYYFDSSGNQIWSTQYTGPTEPALTMDSQGRIYVGSDGGGTAGAWESGPSLNYSRQGLMRILPHAGTLLVVPPTITLYDPAPPNPGGPVIGPEVFSSGGTTLPQPFTVSTTTPWIKVSVPPSFGPPTGVVTPLPNWYGSPAGTFNIAADGSQLQPGTYDGSITLAAPGFSNSPLTVPVHAVIQPPTTFINNLIPSEVVIVGSGGGTTLGLYIALYILFNCKIISATPWITPTPDGTDAFIDDSSLPVGVSTGQVTITDANDPNSPHQVTVYVIEGSYGDGINGVSKNLVGQSGHPVLSRATGRHSKARSSVPSGKCRSANVVHGGFGGPLAHRVAIRRVDAVDSFRYGGPERTPTRHICDSYRYCVQPGGQRGSTDSGEPDGSKRRAVQR
jgi:hypothetical protein